MANRRRERRTPQSKLDATPPWPVRERPEQSETSGPYDLRDHPNDGLIRIDLGGLLVPHVPRFELRLDVGEDQQVMSATLMNATGHMQLGVFAAPRSYGIWDDVRSEIVDSIKAEGGSVTDRADGPFGTELVGSLKVAGRATPVRFIGVDGPRWFLRAMLVGAVAADPVKARPLEDALRSVVVVRGSDPLPVRDPVPLRLPVDAVDADDASDDEFDESDLA
jgi:Protein of unknown function (DUF3710)